MKYKRQAESKTSFFSIGAKLVIIISALVLMSLGSITALVSYLVSQDLRVMAEANNFEINRRSALEAENAFANIQANTLVLVNLFHTENLNREASAKVFFEQNPHIAAFVFTNRDGETLFTNNSFFSSKELDETLAGNWYSRNTLRSRNASLQQNTTILLNEAPHFGLSLLTLVFSWQENSIAVLFSAENLIDSFGFGTNRSYLVNGEDDILIHSDFELMRTGVNVSNDGFIKNMRQSPQRNLQTLYQPQGTESGFPKNLINNIVKLLPQNLRQLLPGFSNENEAETSHFAAYTKLNIAGAVLITTIEYEKVFEGVIETTWRNIYLTAAVLSISIILIWFFAKTISTPIKLLASAARQIEGGVFEVYLKPKGKDEIGLLTASFQKMSGALGIFGKFTNKEIALLAMRGQIKPGGLPKHATIFFSDIRGFTQMSENFTKAFGNEASDKIVFWLNEYLTSMVECVEKTNGTIDKFIGDAVMAHWGTAATSGNPRQDALNCIISALMMRAAVHRMNKVRKAGDISNPIINIGCGINTGIVTAGQIGSDQRMEYTVIGDAVNLASRVESLNKPLGTDILISENTWRMVKNYIICEEMPPVTVKGKEKPIRLFAVINLASSIKGPKTLDQVRQLLGIKAPDMEKVNLDAKEEKFQITGRSG